MRTTSPLFLLKYSLAMLPRRDRRLLGIAAVFQVLLSFLDLAGVALIGVLGSLSVRGVQSQEPGNRVGAVLEFMNLEDQSLQLQVAILGVSAAVLLLSRTFISVFFSRRTMYFLSRRGANISSELTAKLLNQNFLEVNSRSVQESIFAIMSGVSILTLVVLGGVINLITDISLLVVLTSGLILVDYKLAIGTFLFFTGVVSILYLFLHKRVQELGSRGAELNVGINESISDVLTSYRENIVRGRRGFLAKSISKKQIQLASIQAELSFMPSISKYVVEASLVLGTLLICAVQFSSQDATRAVGALVIFLTAGSRIAPATLRIQQSILAFKNAIGSAQPTINLIESLQNIDEVSQNLQDVDFVYANFHPEIEMLNVSLTYPNSNQRALSDISLKIKPGETVAIVGPSGAGKTSLVDTILGVLEPESGIVTISGEQPQDAIRTWPGAIAYVPQDVVISNKSILENITLGYDSESLNEEWAKEALRIAQLHDYVESLPQGLNSLVGERGSKISGGQRQRIGIARALYTNPKLLVLDEATSSLDGQTEADISSSILQLRGKVTIVIIAHRLSTVLNADRIYYLEDGRIAAQGTFSEVRSLVPDFDTQAKLMGL
jgi:ABC-type multidrug transport system fused ATPase/permease subunit